MKQIFSEWGINVVSLLAGMIGGVLHVVMDERTFSFKRALAQILAAMAFSGYGTEWLVHLLGWEDKVSVIGLIGLCLGICGIMLAKAVFGEGKKFEKNPLSYLKKIKSDDTDN